MSDIRPVPPTDAEAFARIAFNAYPVLGAPGAESIARFAERMAKPDPLVHLYGCYRDGRLLGGMRMFDFTMNVFGELLPAGGVGFVATDFSHKKQGVARDLVRGFLRHYREKGASLAVLYPFRFDFYRAMGFGYGTKTQQFRLPPARFPGGPLRQRVRLLGPGDREALAACYDRLFRRTHGLIARRPTELDALFDAPENRIAGYFEEGQLRGYFVFQFKMGDAFIYYDIEIRELMYETREALAGLLAFINVQADQVRNVVFTTQDEHFHYLLDDPRNGSERVQPHVFHETDAGALGLMYRVIDTSGFFRALAGHDFGGETCSLRLTVAHTFLPENAGSVTLAFEQGRAALSDGPHDVEIQLAVAELSSLVMGVVPFRALYDYRLAEISDPAFIPRIDRLFRADTRPVCVTRF